MTQKPKPKYWFFTVTDRHIGEEYWTAEQVFCQRMGVKFWGIPTEARYTKQITPGDKVVFYIAGQQIKNALPKYDGEYFAGICELQSDYKEIDNHEEVERLQLGSSDPDTKRRHGVYLRNVRLFTHQVSLDEAKVRLRIFEDVENIGRFLSGSIHPIRSGDFTILNNLGQPEKIPRKNMNQ